MKKRAPRNRTLSCDEQEIASLSKGLTRLTESVTAEELEGAVVNQDLFEAAKFLPSGFADLIVIDPPYNITKNFNGHLFRQKDRDEYRSWFESVLDILAPALRPQGSVYVCSDWKTSILIAPILEERLCVRNRITWERDKGRGAKLNWKNNTEDIWFCTASEDYYFDVDAVKVKRKVIAPYRDQYGLPKDWDESADGKYRLTHPSNIWSDITIPLSVQAVVVKRRAERGGLWGRVWRGGTGPSSSAEVGSSRWRQSASGWCRWRRWVSAWRCPWVCGVCCSLSARRHPCLIWVLEPAGSATR